MNPMMAISILVVAGIALLWGVQSILLLLSGEKLAPPLRYYTKAPAVVYPMKVMVQTYWLLIIIGYPLLIGVSPVDFYLQAFRLPAPIEAMGILCTTCVVGFALIYGVYYLAGAIEVSMLYSKSKTIRRVIGCFLTPIPLATMEEAVFRGVILHALLNWLDGPWGTFVAIVLSSIIFSSVHFARRRDSRRKPPLQPAIGLFFVGIVLGSAYVAGGQSLWLPIAVHAAGVVAVELPRSFVIYKASPLWIGYRSFPHSGPLGIVLMITLTALTWSLLTPPHF